MRKNKKGFTLAELLIVVAIIAVLVAISIPIFTGQLEKSREATDAANIRSAYAELMANVILNDRAVQSTKVSLVQQQDSWQNTSILGSIAAGYSGQTVVYSGLTDEPTAKGSCTITYIPASFSGSNTESTASVLFEYN